MSINYNDPQPSRELPTEPGVYYWRREEGTSWCVIDVTGPPNTLGLWAIDFGYISDWKRQQGTIGEWIRIPPPEELLRLQESAKWTLREEQSDQKPSGE